MGFSSMVRWMARVAAFAAIVCLLLQAACAIGLPQLTSTPLQAHNDNACHESAPSSPHAPDPSHICCNGGHSSDALLSATIMPAPLVLDRGFLSLTGALRSFAPFSIDFPASLSPPHRLFALRI